MVVGILLAMAGAFMASQNTASKAAVPMVVVGVALVIADLWAR